LEKLRDIHLWQELKPESEFLSEYRMPLLELYTTSSASFATVRASALSSTIISKYSFPKSFKKILFRRYIMLVVLVVLEEHSKDLGLSLSLLLLQLLLVEPKFLTLKDVSVSAARLSGPG
tara:strand:+ start:559 stop:918 length:360 start_codon:yes stop_codon:yes gene_type:complete